MVDTTASNSALSAALRGNSDPTAAGRNALGAELTQLADSIIQSMNGRYGDDFVFAGADGAGSAPFEWNGDDLYYRGVNVSASPNANATATVTVDATVYGSANDLGSVQIDGTALSDMFEATDEDGNVIDLTSADTLTNGQVITLTAKKTGALEDSQVKDLTQAGLTVTDDGSEYQKLVALAGETNYVDIGLGMAVEDGKVVSSSAFNDSLTGISYLGYGVDEDGDSKNIAVLLRQMGQLLSNCDANGNWASESDAEVFNRLIGKLEDASNTFKSALVELDTKASFLADNGTNLLTSADTVNEQFLEIEQCDLADAITSYSWAQYCYNAALKVGNSILSQSLLDYMD
jgi:flagellin-like hook-associated protein FlgL